ncbi:hypothetical protein AB0O91_13300 [Kitasatospora sp. NPDC089797]|uniref:hypothetical protein n=1 Tax=Kitasatospora sp. NPDC089797 TaxID=3155298 RepID=UPI003434B8EA
MSRPAADQHPSLLTWYTGAHPGPYPGPSPDPDPGPDAPDLPDARTYTCTSAAPPAAAAHITAAPAPFPSDHEQAFHELDLAVALVLNAPQAHRSLDLLVDSDQVHPEGALVFGSLLFVTRRVDAAQFWWQFAAGSGSATAAYLLHLHHLTLGETRDAAHWRGEAETLPAGPRAARVFRASRQLLPEDVRRDLLARCHGGLHPRLPGALESVINRLTVLCDDPDFGEVPQPSATLAGGLAG